MWHEMESLVHGILISMMILSVPLIVLVYNRRELANLILYFEMTRLAVEGLVPMSSWNTAPGMMNFTLFSLVYACLHTSQVC